MNKMVEQAKRMLEESGVEPEMLEVAVATAKQLDEMQKITEQLFKARQECAKLSDETGRLAREVKAMRVHNRMLLDENEEIKEAGLVFIDETYEFLDRLVNVNLESKEQLKELQEVASRKMNLIKLVLLYSR